MLLADVTKGPVEQWSVGSQRAGSTAVQAAFKREPANPAREPQLPATHAVRPVEHGHASPFMHCHVTRAQLRG